jgi:YidC/Oxa1 family membrane protein insertase
MEKRALIAIVISFLILVGWSYLFPPADRPAEPLPATVEEASAPRQPESIPVDSKQEPAEAVEAGASEQPRQEKAIQAEAEEEISITNSVHDVLLTNRGGVATSWKLQRYTTPDGQPLQLLPTYTEGATGFLGIELGEPSLSKLLEEALFSVEREKVYADGAKGPGERITFTWSDGRGLMATKSLLFRDGEYIIEVELEVTENGRPKRAALVLGPGFAAQEPGDNKSNYYYNGQIVWNRSGEVTRLRKKRIEPIGSVSGQIRWAGLEDQYFASLIVPPDSPVDVGWTTVELTAIPAFSDTEEAEKIEMQAEPLLSVALPSGAARLYVGPKKYTMLRATGSELEKSVWFSSYGWLRPIVKALFLALLWIYDNVAGNYGLAIILATVVLRLVLFPVNQYSMVKMKKSQLQMQHLQPKIKSIKAKYKKQKDAQSRAKMNQEMMALYKQEGINPMGGMAGCLPLLAQFPILIGFYNMLTVAVELRGAPFFGWIMDLSQKDPYWITPLLMGVTMFVQQKLAMSKIKDPQQLQQQRFMMFMPFMFTFICLQMPSGLVLYWFINNLLGIGQQWLVNKQTSKLEAPPAREKGKDKKKKA